jgi:hypothetical protein
MYLLIYFCKQGEEDVVSQNDRNAEVALVDLGVHEGEGEELFPGDYNFIVS